MPFGATRAGQINHTGVHIGATWRIRWNDLCGCISIGSSVVAGPTVMTSKQTDKQTTLHHDVTISSSVAAGEMRGHMPPTAVRPGHGNCRNPRKTTGGGWGYRIILAKQQHPFNGPLSGTTRMSRYQKGKTNLDFTEARDSEWQWHQLGHASLPLVPDR